MRILETRGPPRVEYTAPPTALSVQFILALFKSSTGKAETIWGTLQVPTQGKVSNLNFKLGSFYVYLRVEKLENSNNMEVFGLIDYRLLCLLSCLL